MTSAASCCRGPFKIRRLGHFGISVDDVPATLPFYTDLLGFDISDTIGLQPDLQPGRARRRSRVGYLLRHSPEHHSFVLFSAAADARQSEHLERHERSVHQPDHLAGGQLAGGGGRQRVFCRLRVAGLASGARYSWSNWHCYPVGLDGHVQRSVSTAWRSSAGMDTASPPPCMPFATRDSRFAASAGTSRNRSRLRARRQARWGTRAAAVAAPRFDVGGVLLPRPFKLIRMGPVNIFVKDLELALRSYRDIFWTDAHRGNSLRRSSLPVFPGRQRASQPGCVPDRTARATGLSFFYDAHELRTPSSRLSSAT